MKIKQYADSIVVKTARSYQRILDEVSLFLHLVEENRNDNSPYRRTRKMEAGEVLKGKTVLVVDDDVRNIFSLSKSLESLWHERHFCHRWQRSIEATGSQLRKLIWCLWI